MCTCTRGHTVMCTYVHTILYSACFYVISLKRSRFSKITKIAIGIFTFFLQYCTAHSLMSCWKMGWALSGIAGLSFFTATASMTAMGTMWPSGTRPHAISYTTMPNPYTSAGNWYLKLLRTSGAVQCTVPMLPGAQQRNIVGVVKLSPYAAGPAHLSWWQTPASSWTDQNHRAWPGMECGQSATHSYSSGPWGKKASTQYILYMTECTLYGIYTECTLYGIYTECTLYGIEYCGVEGL